MHHDAATKVNAYFLPIGGTTLGVIRYLRSDDRRPEHCSADIDEWGFALRDRGSAFPRALPMRPPLIESRHGNTFFPAEKDRRLAAGLKPLLLIVQFELGYTRPACVASHFNSPHH
jgi:hypothetical protein